MTNEENSLLKGVLDNALSGIMAFRSIRDDNGIIVDFEWIEANSYAEKIVGRSRDQLIGNSLLSEMPGNKTEGLFAKYCEVVEDDEPTEFVIDYQQDGVNAVLLVKASKFQDGFVVTFNDITAEHDTNKTMIELAQRLDLATGAFHIGIFDFDLHKNHLIWNDQMLHLYGVDQSNFGFSYEDWRQRLHPEDVELAEQAYEQAIGGQKRFDVCFRIITPSGQLKYVRGNATVIRDEKGVATRMVGINVDVSEETLHKEELNEATNKAKQANETKTRFLSAMSHELRTPLNAIMGFSELLMMQNASNNKIMKQTQQIHQAGKHLLYLVEQILDLSSLEKGEFELSCEDIDVRQILEDCEMFSRSMMKEKGLSFKLSSHVDETCLINVDVKRLYQIIQTFIANAAKYTEQGEITLSGYLKDEAVIISVADTGCGIHEELYATLFEPFASFSNMLEHVEGSGVSLSLCKEIAQRMGIKLDFESELGKGSRFWVEIPVVVSETSDTSEQEAEGRSSEIYQVLYVEDNATNMFLMTELLSDWSSKLELEVVKTPREAIERAQEKTFDLYLLDINLPQMSGFELLAELKKMPSWKGQPTFAITGNVMPDDIEKGQEAGFDEYVGKPFDVEMLFKLLNNYLDKLG